jgi:hypothetical protein
MNGLIEQTEFFRVWRLKGRRPPFEVSPRDRRGAPLAGLVASLGPLDQLVERRVQMVQLNAYPQITRTEPLLVPFCSKPMAPHQDHALTVGEKVLGEGPEFAFETLPELVVPNIVT